MDYHHPSENTIKNFDIDINLHSENYDKNDNQLDLPIQEENDHQLNLFDEESFDDDFYPSGSQEINPKEVVYKLFIKPRFDSVFYGLKVRQVLEAKGMHVEQLPIFCKKIMVERIILFLMSQICMSQE